MSEISERFTIIITDRMRSVSKYELKKKFFLLVAAGNIFQKHKKNVITTEQNPSSPEIVDISNLDKNHMLNTLYHNQKQNYYLESTQFKTNQLKWLEEQKSQGTEKLQLQIHLALTRRPLILEFNHAILAAKQDIDLKFTIFSGQLSKTIKFIKEYIQTIQEKNYSISARTLLIMLSKAMTEEPNKQMVSIKNLLIVLGKNSTIFLSYLHYYTMQYNFTLIES
ncbi:hypothetical protein ABPG72_010132 [Tetrahymena utriculariae]